MKVKSLSGCKAKLEEPELSVLIIKAELVKSIEELKLAEYLTNRAFADKKNIATKYKYEFLLWLCGKSDIKRAIEVTKPKENEEALLIIINDNDQQAARKILINAKIKIINETGDLTNEASALALERISLSRI